LKEEAQKNPNRTEVFAILPAFGAWPTIFVWQEVRGNHLLHNQFACLDNQLFQPKSHPLTHFLGGKTMALRRIKTAMKIKCSPQIKRILNTSGWL